MAGDTQYILGPRTYFRHDRLGMKSWERADFGTDVVCTKCGRTSPYVGEKTCARCGTELPASAEPYPIDLVQAPEGAAIQICAPVDPLEC